MKKRTHQPNFTIFLICTILLGCNTNTTQQTTDIKFKNFNITFDTPPSFTSEDSIGYNGLFLLKNWKDTIHFNIGYSEIDNLSETLPEVIYTAYDTNQIKANIDSNLLNKSKLTIYTNKISFDIDEYRKQNIYFTNISGYTAKITLPIQILKGGMTGVYFDNIMNTPGGRRRFNLYANNLDSMQSVQLLKAIRTIHFNYNP